MMMMTNEFMMKKRTKNPHHSLLDQRKRPSGGSWDRL